MVSEKAFIRGKRVPVKTLHFTCGFIVAFVLVSCFLYAQDNILEKFKELRQKKAKGLITDQQFDEQSKALKKLPAIIRPESLSYEQNLATATIISAGNNSNDVEKYPELLKVKLLKPNMTIKEVISLFGKPIEKGGNYLEYRIFYVVTNGKTLFYVRPKEGFEKLFDGLSLDFQVPVKSEYTQEEYEARNAELRLKGRKNSTLAILQEVESLYKDSMEILSAELWNSEKERLIAQAKTILQKIDSADLLVNSYRVKEFLYIYEEFGTGRHSSIRVLNRLHTGFKQMVYYLK